jgi:hypothetical protein
MRLCPQTIPILLLLLFPSTILAIPTPTPEPQIPTFGPTPTLPATQYPTVTVAGSLFTVNGVVSATWVEFTQSFATTALGSWGLGATLRVGKVGLGGLDGNGGKSVVGGKERAKEKRGRGESENDEGGVKGEETNERGEEEEGNGGVKEKRAWERKKGEEKR